MPSSAEAPESFSDDPVKTAARSALDTLLEGQGINTDDLIELSRKDPTAYKVKS